MRELLSDLEKLEMEAIDHPAECLCPTCQLWVAAMCEEDETGI